MTKNVDMTELEEVLDAREWRIIRTFEPGAADALQRIIQRGATDEDLRRLLSGYLDDDRVIERIKLAARHLRRERDRAQ